MNGDFLESLQNSIDPAPEMPVAVVQALAGRRLKRRIIRVAASSAAAIVLASAVLMVRGVGPAGMDKAWEAGGEGGGGEGWSVPIAHAPSTDGADWPSQLSEEGPLTIASLYTGGSRSVGEGGEGSGVGAGHGTDQILRIGDQWDLDRVTEWVMK